MPVCTVTPPWTSELSCASDAEGLLGASRSLGTGALLVADTGASTHELPAFPLPALAGRLDGVGQPAAAAVERGRDHHDLVKVDHLANVLSLWHGGLGVRSAGVRATARAAHGPEARRAQSGGGVVPEDLEPHVEVGRV